MRVYDSTVADDYYRAIDQIEGHPEGALDQAFDGEELLALLDVLQSGALDEAQQKALHVLRATILTLNRDRVPGGEEDGSSTKVVWQRRPRRV